VTNEDLAEWLAKLGPAGTWGPPTSRSTALGRWTPADLSAALGLVQPTWLGNVLLWIYAEQGVSSRLVLEIEMEKGFDEFPKLRTEQCRVLLSIALWELRSRFECAACQGRGEIIDGAVKVTCPACEGSGQSAKFSKRARAQMSGVSPATWNSRYEQHYQVVYSWLRGMVAEGLRQLKKGLR
jgi:hypothetical protein